MWHCMLQYVVGTGIAAIKQMAALFMAFDRPNYQKLIPHHLLELHTMSSDVLSSLKQGFTVSILGRPCHSIAVDEAHETASTSLNPQQTT